MGYFSDNCKLEIYDGNTDLSLREDEPPQYQVRKTHVPWV